MLALVLAVCAQDEVLVGDLRRDARTGAYSVGESRVDIAPTVHAGHPLVGKRVQIIGKRPREGAPLEAALVNEMEPAERDLVLRVGASADWGRAGADDRIVVEVREYFPNPRHRHPGSCRVHAWTRGRAEGKAGEAAAEREVRIPAYKETVNVKVFVRVTAPRCKAAESREFSWNGKAWLDPELKDVDGARAVEVALKP